jgi:nucleoside 2-deoxyribosyltransferase
MSTKYIYVAGPLFNMHERWYLERITEALEGAGYRTFLPHRDAGLVKLGSSEDRLRIFTVDIDALNAADFIVALLTGADHDSGTSAELGYMFALGKPCFGINDDKRGALNNIIWGICSNGQRIARSIDELLSLIREGAEGDRK